MNPLEQYPHLFANGKFKIKKSSIVITTFNGESYSDIEHNGASGFKLVARPISDMSDEEAKTSPVIGQLVDNPDIASCYDLTVQEFLYLLSIGVYPFDQSDFGETVIDSTTL